MTMFLVVLAVVWAVSGPLAYRMEFNFWKWMKNLSYSREAQVGVVFLKIRRLQIPVAPNFRVVTEYQSGNADVHRLVSNRAMIAAILGPIGLADAFAATWRKNDWGRFLIPVKSAAVNFSKGFADAIRSRYRGRK